MNEKTLLENAAASADSGAPKETEQAPGFLGKLLKRRGRHKKGCQCENCKRKYPEQTSKAANRFAAPELPASDAPAELFAEESKPSNPGRFAAWGRMASRLVKSVFKIATA